MWIQQRTRGRALGAAVMVALMLVCGVAAFAALKSSSTSLNFPGQAVGTTSGPVPVSISNTNGASVTITSASISAAQFSYSGLAFPITLRKGQTFTASVTFTPAAAQIYSGALRFPRKGGSLVSVSLSGTGTQTITISNTGTAAATVNAASVSGTGFTRGGLATPMSLAAGAGASFSVQFAPPAAGTDSGSVMATSTTPNSPTLVGLNGTGTPPVARSVTLSWVASTSSTVVGYNIYRGSVSGGPNAMLNSAPNADLTYTDTTVAAGQTHFYVVTAVDSSGTESVVSKEVSVIIPTP